MRRPNVSLLVLCVLVSWGCASSPSHGPGAGSASADVGTPDAARSADGGPRPGRDLALPDDLADSSGDASDAGPSGPDLANDADATVGADLAADGGGRDAEIPDAGRSADLAGADLGAPVEDLHVVVVIIDGARYSESMGSPERANVPRMAALAERGCAGGPIRNVGTTITSYSVGMILTGVTDAWETTPDVPQGGYSAPTVWEYYRRQLGAPADDAWYVLRYISVASRWTQSHHPDYGPDYWGSVRSSGRTDADATDELLAILQGSAPHLVVLYLADVDGAGHSGDWDNYLSTLQRADAAVGRLWDAIEAHPVLGGRTVLLVTNDHGRHDAEHGDFQGHGCGCDGCRQVMLLAAGPGVDPDCRPDHEYTTLDIAPTVGRLLGFDPELAEGRPMEGVFVPGFLHAQ